MKKGRRMILLIFLIAAAAFVFYGVRYMRRPVNTQAVFLSQHRDQITAQAYLVRTEHVYQAEKTGTFYSAGGEGARVGKQRQIASVYTGNIDMDALTELNNLNKKIAESEQKLRNTSMFAEDAQTDENRVESIKDKIIEAADANDIAKIGTYKGELAAALSGGSAAEGQISADALKEERERVEQRLSGVKQDIFSDISGIYTTNVDGLEDVLTRQNVLTYTPSDYDALMPPEKKSTPTGVSTGDRICKVVDNHEWSILVKVPAERLASCQTGDKVSLMFDASPGVEASAELIYKSEEQDGFVAAVFESEHYIEGIFTVRTSSVDIIFHTYTGYRVPVHAVRVIDGKTGVMRQERGTEVFCACDVLYTNSEEGYSVVYPAENAERKLENGNYISLGEKTKERLQ